MKNFEYRLTQSNSSSEESLSQAETDPGKSYDGYNKYEDIKNVWAKTPLQRPSNLPRLIQLLLAVLGVLSLLALIKCTVWLKQQAEIKMEGYLNTGHTIIFPETHIGDLINYAADYNHAYIDTSQTLLNLYGKLTPVLSSNSPAMLLSDDNSPGKCWGFRGTPGFVTIVLSTAVLPTKFTILHANLAEYSKAPRDICVYSVDSPDIDQCLELGCYTLALDSQQAWSAIFHCYDDK